MKFGRDTEMTSRPGFSGGEKDGSYRRLGSQRTP